MDHSWFTGHGTYHNFIECLDGDVITAAIICVLGLANVIAYVIIGYNWFCISRQLRATPARKSFDLLAFIFFYCAICGYLWHPIQLFWPGWKLYILLLAVLVFYSWRFILYKNSMGHIRDYFIEKEVLHEELARIKRGIRDLK